jgi:hypothetical protein
MAFHNPLNAAKMVHIPYDVLADSSNDRAYQSSAARRHVHDLAGKLFPAFEHVAPKQIDLHALMPSAVMLGYTGQEGSGIVN